MMGKESALTPVSQEGGMLDHFHSGTVFMFCLCSDIVMKRLVLVWLQPGPQVASSDVDTL